MLSENIRKAEIKDASRIAEILIFGKRAAYRNVFNNDKVSFGEMQVLPLALKLQNDIDLLYSYYVYDDEFVKGVIRIEKNNTELYIHELYVDMFFINQGIGRKLIEFAQKNSADNFILWVLEKNKAAISFYEKNGFIYANERKIEDNTTEYILKYTKKNKSLF